MRTKSFQQILNVTASPPGLTTLVGEFGPTVDNQTVFSDYAARAAAGQFTRRPYFASNDYQAGSIKMTTAAAGIPLSAIDWAIYKVFTTSCPTSIAPLELSIHGVLTWRYEDWDC